MSINPADHTYSCTFCSTANYYVGITHILRCRACLRPFLISPSSAVSTAFSSPYPTPPVAMNPSTYSPNLPWATTFSHHLLPSLSPSSPSPSSPSSSSLSDRSSGSPHRHRAASQPPVIADHLLSTTTPTKPPDRFPSFRSSKKPLESVTSYLIIDDPLSPRDSPIPLSSPLASTPTSASTPSLSSSAASSPSLLHDAPTSPSTHPPPPSSSSSSFAASDALSSPSHSPSPLPSHSPSLTPHRPQAAEAPDSSPTSSHKPANARNILAFRSESVPSSPIKRAISIDTLHRMRSVSLPPPPFEVATRPPTHAPRLIIACWNGDASGLRGFLSKRASINTNVSAIPDAVVPPLYLAVQRGHLEVCQILLELLHVDATQPNGIDGASPLSLAVYRNQLSIVKLLLAHNAAREFDEQSSPANKPTPLRMAVGYQSSPQILRVLLDAGAGLNLAELSQALLFANYHHVSAYLLPLLACVPDSLAASAQIPMTLLNLSHLQLTEVPATVGNLVHLTELNLAHNKLTHLPSNLAQLTRLTKLDLAHNDLKSIPPEFVALVHLQDFRFSHNPSLEHPYQEYVKKPLSLLRFLQTQDQLINWAHLCLISLGHNFTDQMQLFSDRGFLGRPRLSNSLFHQRFNPPRKSTFTRTTIKTSAATLPALKSDSMASLPPDVDHHPTVFRFDWRISDELSFSALNFSEQSMRYQLFEFFLTSAALYLVFFDLTKPAQDIFLELEYWLKKLKQRILLQASVLIVGLGLDKIPSTTATQLESSLRKRFPRKIYPQIRGTHFVSLQHKETFLPLREQLIEVGSQHGLMQHQVPRFYETILAGIVAFRSTAKTCIVDKSDFLSSLNRHCILPPIESIKKALQFLSKAGHIVYFPEVSDLIFLDPQALMAPLIAHHQSGKIASGIVSSQQIRQIWSDLPLDLYPKLLATLEHLGVVFLCPSSDAELPLAPADQFARQTSLYVRGGSGISDASRFPLKGHYHVLIPSLLPESRPADSAPVWPQYPTKLQYEFTRNYTFSCLPVDIFGRILAACLYIQDGSMVAMWRGGFILRVDQDIALIELQPRRYHLRIAVRSPRLPAAASTEPGCTLCPLLHVVVEVVDTLIEAYYLPLKASLLKSIECPHCAEKEDPFLNPYLFPYDECISAVRRSQPFVFCCNVPTRMVRIDRLAPDVALSCLPILPPDCITQTAAIGEGGFGIVYRGSLQLPLSQRQVDIAIKEMKSDSSGSGSAGGGIHQSKTVVESFDGFRQEAYVMSFLNHPNLVRFYGITTMPSLRIILEFMPAGDLYHYLHTSSRPLADAMKIRLCRDIACGLRYLHSLSPPVVHRDLRSPNIFLTAAFTEQNEDNPDVLQVMAKIGDFGLSRRLGSLLSGMLKTWQWMPPEVIDARQIQFDERCDVYSLGIVMWEIWTAQHPFQEYEQFMDKFTDEQGHQHFIWKEIAIKRAIIDDDLRPTISPQHHLPETLRKAILSCWKRDYRQRPTSSSIFRRLCQSEYQARSLFDSSKTGNIVREQSVSKELRALVNMIEDSQRQLQTDPERSQSNPLSALLSPFTTFQCPARVLCLQSVGQRVYAGLSDGFVRMYSVISPTPTPRGGHRERCMSVPPMRSFYPPALPAGASTPVCSSHDAPPALEKPGPSMGISSEIHSIEFVSQAKALEGRVYTLLVVGNTIWAAGDGGFISIFNWLDLQLVRRFQAHATFIKCALIVPIFNPETSVISTIIWTSSPLTPDIRCWDSHGQPSTFFSSIDVQEGIQAMLLDGRKVWLAVDRDLIVINSNTGDLIHHIEDAHDSQIVSMCLVPDFIVSGSLDSKIHLWNPQDAQLVRVISIHTHKIQALGSTSDYFFSSGFDKSIIVHDAHNHQPLQEIVGAHRDSIRCLHFQHTNKLLWVGSFDRSISVWQLRSLLMDSSGPSL